MDNSKLYEDGFVSKKEQAEKMLEKGKSISEISRKLEVSEEKIEEYKRVLEEEEKTNLNE